jgi:glycyl-tRNA synthetase beta chain
MPARRVPVNNANTSPTSSAGVQAADLLIELGCEELPPKSLALLGESFLAGFSAQLEKAGIEFNSKASRLFYTPRRLTLLMSQVANGQPDQVLERKGPAVMAAFDAAGKPTPAAMGFARSVGKSVEDLDTLKTDQGEWLFCKVEKTGEPLSDLLFPMLEKTLADLPVAKPMRWANNDFSFIRPVHWLVVIYGNSVMPGELFGLQAGNNTRGHRIHSPGPHTIDSPAKYVEVLKSAYVMVDQALRKQTIVQQAHEAAEGSEGKVLIDDNLLDEVTNLVEWPQAVMGSFDKAFLEIPSEALIASMQDHQKFFPVVDKNSGALFAQFITIANLESADINAVRQGFERVIRPRLADARFFWEQDSKSAISGWLPRLDSIVFQNKLGSIGDKSRRIAIISEKIAAETGVNVKLARRAAELCKADLVSHMVGEFPELQGTMGGYYALNSGEDPLVGLAVSEHYQPAFSGDQLPSHAVGKVVALADRLDSLAGIFATGLKPSGNKDPFALRRAALGLIRILQDGELSIELDKLLAISANAVEQQLHLSPKVLLELRQFILERLKNWLCDQGYSTKLVNAVLDAPLGTLPDLSARLEAVQGFMALDVSANLADANKRIGNILRKSEHSGSGEIDENVMNIDEEKHLFSEINTISANLEDLYKAGDYEAGLGLLLGLSDSIEAFFDKVMVMDEDPKIRANRLNLLARLKGMFDRVANFAEAV